MARCDPRDHALLNELVMGTLRWLRRLDHLISVAANRPFHKIEEPLRNPVAAGRLPAVLPRSSTGPCDRSRSRRSGRACHPSRRRQLRQRGSPSTGSRQEPRRLAGRGRRSGASGWRSKPAIPIFWWSAISSVWAPRKTQILLHNNNRPKHLHLLELSRSWRPRGCG